MRVVVLDNLRGGVLTADVCDPDINPLCRDVLKHYDAVALPCRVRDPDRKGKVASGVGHAQKTPLKAAGLRVGELLEQDVRLAVANARAASHRSNAPWLRRPAHVEAASMVAQAEATVRARLDDLRGHLSADPGLPREFLKRTRSRRPWSRRHSA